MDDDILDEIRQLLLKVVVPELRTLADKLDACQAQREASAERFNEHLEAMRMEVLAARDEMIAFRAEMNQMRAELQEWREERDRIEGGDQLPPGPKYLIH
jgi:chromosome segregation ATPase